MGDFLDFDLKILRERIFLSF